MTAQPTFRDHLTSLAAAMGYRLVPAEGETK